MIEKHFEKTPYLQFEIFQSLPLRHATFTREGGVSQGPFDSFNLSFEQQDNPEHVNLNRQKALKILSCDFWVEATQVHGEHIVEVTRADLPLPCADALVTRIKHLPLAIKHADCQAAILYDPVNEVLACVHVGWRGLVNNMYQKTIAFLHERFNTESGNLLVGISPFMHQAEFRHYLVELNDTFFPFKEGECYFNLKAYTQMVLLKLGVKKENIEIAPWCTYRHEKRFFSFRRDKKCGRMATAALMI